MHVVIHTQYYPPEMGAPQGRLSALAHRLAQHGHKVTVLTAMPNYPTGKIYPGYGGILQRELVDGVNVIHTPIYATRSAELVPRLANYFSFALSSALFGSLLLRRPDYLLVESPPLFLGLAGWWLSRLKHARLIFNVSDLWPESVVQLGMLRQESMAFTVAAQLERFFYRQAWLVTGQTRGIVADILHRFPKSRVLHFSNGVDVKLFTPDGATDQSRQLLATNPEECLIMYAGLHGLAQGLNQVLDAAQMLQGETNFRFVLIGDGPEKAQLQEEAAKRRLVNVQFLDQRSRDEVATLLPAADIILVPLRINIPVAAPSKLYEAMACGRPVIVLSSGEGAAIVKENCAGLAVEPGDVEGLVRAIRTLHAQPSLRQALGRNGRQTAEQQFDRTIILDRFIDYLEINQRPISTKPSIAATVVQDGNPTKLLVRNIQVKDLQRVAVIHCAAFGASALTKLGREAVRRYYEWQLIGPHDRVALGAYLHGVMVGFCFGGISRGALSGFLSVNRRFLLRQVMTHPWLIVNPIFRNRLRSAINLLMKQSHSNREAPPLVETNRHFGILSIAVHPGFQRHGIGSALMTEMERIAVERGFVSMGLSVAPANAQAIHFYESSGWEKTPMDGMWNGSMRKNLREGTIVASKP